MPRVTQPGRRAESGCVGKGGWGGVVRLHGLAVTPREHMSPALVTATDVVIVQRALQGASASPSPHLSDPSESRGSLGSQEPRRE